MASFYERKNEDGTTTWRAFVRIKGHPAQSQSFKRKTDARKWAASTEAAIREGRFFPTNEARKHTVADLIDRYIRDYVEQKRDARNQKRQLAWWKKQIGAYALSDVTPSLLAEKRDELKAGGRAASTANRYMAPFSHAFTIAMKEYGWVQQNPFARVTKGKEPRGRVRFLSDDERERLLLACRESKQLFLYPAVILALSTGARRTELLSIRWEQVNFDNESIVLHHTKNDERRVLPLKGHALDLVRGLHDKRDPNSPLVFPSRRDPNRPIDLRKAFDLARERARIEDFRWHDLRHTAASYLAMSGSSPAVIAEILGHKTLEMVKRYSHLSTSYVADHVAAMNDKFLSSKP